MDSAGIKRAVDVVAAATGLLLSVPVMAAAALAIKIDSRGPVLFRQSRVGRNGRPFQLLKLRTMVTRAEHRGPAITAGGDPRITTVGRLLRRTKLDELPQLVNVLRGELSLVGPRPEVPQYVEGYRPEWRQLLDVAPGLTDLGSIVFRDEEQLLARARDRDRAYREVIMPLKLELALEGVRASSLIYDAGIVARTALAVLGVHDRRARTVIANAERRIASLEGCPS